ncbi:MAG: T9SS type A sorting domain-containing protein [Cryomorphaceae bacterium]|nr:T9SS type A sorting domain-containing protein [Cryomorphaceae bacterium]
MKKFYISLLGLLAVGTVSAQVTSVSPAKKHATISEKVKPSANLVEKGATLWSNDFTNASDWTFQNTSTDGNGNPASVDWVITADASASPSGAFVPFGFTNIGNYALIDSDTEGQGASQNADITTALPATNGGNPFPANVSLVFEQAYRTYLDIREVHISTNGTTWTPFVVTDGTENTGVNTANPDLYSVNISSVAAGQTQVWVRFHYEATWGWFWAVDNVKIVETDDYDLKMQDVYWGSVGAWGTYLPYYQIPTTQVTDIEFGGIIKNNGAVAQSDIKFNATTTGYTGMSATAPLQPAELDTFWTTTPFAPAATVAAHSVNFSASSTATEAYPVGNTLPATTINVTNYTYARDKGTAAGGTYNAGEGFEVGNIYDMYANATLKGVDVQISTSAVAGAEIYATLYSIDPATGDFIYMEASAPYVLTSGNLGQLITLPLQSAQALNAGEPYLIVVGSYGDGGLTNDLVVATAGTSEAQTTFYYDMTDATWYYTTSTPMVRMNFNPVVGVNEVENTYALSVYPNPANTNATVSFSLNNEAAVSINVTDLSGKVVYMNTLGTVNGTQSVNVTTDALKSGVYMVNVTVDGNVSTQKLVIRK